MEAAVVCCCCLLLLFAVVCCCCLLLFAVSTFENQVTRQTSGEDVRYDRVDGEEKGPQEACHEAPKGLTVAAIGLKSQEDFGITQGIEEVHFGSPFQAVDVQSAH